MQDTVDRSRLLSDVGAPANARWRTTIRQRCWLVVGGEHHKGYLPGHVFQVAIMLLISLNVVLVIVDTEPAYEDAVDGPFSRFYSYVELFSVAVFGLEYLLRLWSCVESVRFVTESGECHRRVRWALTPLALIDLVALVPFVFDLAFPQNNKLRAAMLIRLLRIFSLLRMERSFHSFARVARVLRCKSEELLVTLFIAVIILILSASLMYYLENGGSEPTSKFTSISTSMWWSVTALTTVGYGDIYPTTVPGRVLGAFTAFVGVGLFALPAGIFASGFAELLEGTDEAEDDEKRKRQLALSPVASAVAAALPLSGGPARASSVSEAGGAAASPEAGAGVQLELSVLRHALAALDAKQPQLAEALLRERLAALTSG